MLVLRLVVLMSSEVVVLQLVVLASYDAYCHDTVIVMSSQVVVLQLVVLMSSQLVCPAVLRQLHLVVLACGSLCVLLSDWRSSHVAVWQGRFSAGRCRMRWTSPSTFISRFSCLVFYRWACELSRI